MRQRKLLKIVQEGMTFHAAIFHEAVEILGVDEDLAALPFGAKAVMRQTLLLAPLIDQGGGDARVLPRLFHRQLHHNYLRWTRHPWRYKSALFGFANASWPPAHAKTSTGQCYQSLI